MVCEILVYSCLVVGELTVLDGERPIWFDEVMLFEILEEAIVVDGIITGIDPAVTLLPLLMLVVV